MSPHSETPALSAARSPTEIRAWIVRELADSLNVSAASIDTSAPLETIGIDSLAAFGMTGGLAGWLGRDLPATLMWDYSSVNAIAEALADRPDGSAEPEPSDKGVIVFQSVGDRRPIFFLPGLGGHPVTFAAMAAHLGPAQPSYGLIAPSLYGGREIYSTVEAIATAMIAAVKRVQPKGPYQLAGYSFGGFLAFEMAQQFVAAGESVSMLAIYDTFTPAGRVARPRWQRLALHAYLLATRPGRRQYLRDRMKHRRAIAAEAIEPMPVESTLGVPVASELAKQVMRVHKHAATRYQPRRYPGRVHLFRATDRAIHNVFYRVDHANGWSDVVDGSVKVIDLPGCHSGLLAGVRAAGAAQALSACLGATK